MNELLLAMIVTVAAWIVVSVIIMLGISWTHYPHGWKKGRRR